MLCLSNRLAACVAATVLLIGCAPADNESPTAAQATTASPNPSPAVVEDDTEEIASAEHLSVESPDVEPVAEELEADTEVVEPEPSPAAEEMAEDPVEEVEEVRPDLGPALVDDPESLDPLDPEDPIWLTEDRKSVVMIGLVCARNVPLEHFACKFRSKEHESIISLNVKGYVIHAGLLATDAEEGNPVLFYPDYVPASGTEIEITLVWEDEQGKRQRARAQDWIRKSGSEETMEHAFVFGGSQFVKDELTGRERYLADGTGDFFCVSNFSSAILDLPVRSSDTASSLMFMANTDRIPPLGTRVTLILTPKLEEAEEE